MKMETMGIHELQPALYNPRKISEDELNNLKRSIQEFGYVEPIILNERTGNIVGGHQRLKALKSLGYEEIDVTIIDLDEQKEKALNVALNKISGEFDKPALKDLIESIDDGDFDVTLTGFGEDEIEKMMNEFGEDEQQPEVEFAEELLEEHNYVVLYFDNQMDWQTAKEKLGIKSEAALDSKEGYERKGIGRVIRGDKVMHRIMDQ